MGVKAGFARLINRGLPEPVQPCFSNASLAAFAVICRFKIAVALPSRCHGTRLLRCRLKMPNKYLFLATAPRDSVAYKPLKCNLTFRHDLEEANHKTPTFDLA